MSLKIFQTHTHTYITTFVSVSIASRLACSSLVYSVYLCLFFIFSVLMPKRIAFIFHLYSLSSYSFTHRHIDTYTHTYIALPLDPGYNRCLPQVGKVWVILPDSAEEFKEEQSNIESDLMYISIHTAWFCI